jgi:1-acyl-sn-glycerol-3-phosphate acyltransferase
VRIAGLGATTATLLPLYLARERMTVARGKAALRHRWVAAWAGTLLGLFGLRTIVRGSALSPGRGHLVVANHRSTADILLLLRVFGGKIVSRSDLASWPLVGVAARAVGTLFVDRSDAISGANAVRKMRSSLLSGDTVIVFPEGTTFPGDQVRPFRAGAFVAALRSGADIVPVGLAYARDSGAAFVNESFLTHLARVASAEPSCVAMCIGEPIPIDEGARAAQLGERARAAVQALVDEARRVVDGPAQ